MTEQKRWHSVNCAHVGIFRQSSKGGDVTCPGCLAMRADGVRPQQREPVEVVGYSRKYGDPYTPTRNVDSAVAAKVDSERRWRRHLEAEAAESRYEQLLRRRDEMGGAG